MASLWFILSIFLYIISEMSAIPLRILPKESIGLDEKARLKRESDLFEKKIRSSRNRRVAGNAVPSGCEKGNVYGVAEVAHCHVTNAEYNEEMKLCLVELLHVPGMTDGEKGSNYLAHAHFLYRFYNATTTLGIVKCPTNPPTVSTTTVKIPSVPTTKLQTTSNPGFNSSVSTGNMTEPDYSSTPSANLSTKPTTTNITTTYTQPEVATS